MKLQTYNIRYSDCHDPIIESFAIANPSGNIKKINEATKKCLELLHQSNPQEFPEVILLNTVGDETLFDSDIIVPFVAVAMMDSPKGVTFRFDITVTRDKDILMIPSDERIF